MTTREPPGGLNDYQGASRTLYTGTSKTLYTGTSKTLYLGYL